MAVTAGEHVQAGNAGAGTEAFHGRFPIHAQGAVAVFFADHDLGTVDKGAADDGVDRFGAEAGALAQHIVADGREGRTVDHTLIDILAEGLQFPVDLLAEGRIGHQSLEIRGDFLEGLLRIGSMVQGRLQHVDEHLAHLVLGLDDQDAVLLGKAAQILGGRLGQFENSCNHLRK